MSDDALVMTQNSLEVLLILFTQRRSRFNSEMHICSVAWQLAKAWMAVAAREVH